MKLRRKKIAMRGVEDSDFKKGMGRIKMMKRMTEREWYKERDGDNDVEGGR